MATITGTSGNDTLTGGFGSDVIYGGAGDDRLDGGFGSDALYGGVGNDTLTGGFHSDTFVHEFDFGNDTITDFDLNADKVAIRAGGISSFADIQARMTQVGSDTLLTTDKGATLLFQGRTPSEFNAGHFIIGSPVCYAEGTRILTARGEVPVEDVTVGDLLVTADNGPRPVRWIGVSRHEFAPGPHRHKPIEIKPGALGAGPRRRLVVSPQHRMVMRGAEVARLFGEREVLALAKGLTGLPGVRTMHGKRDVTYYSLLCDRHEVAMAEGAWSETFYPGPTALRLVDAGLRAEIETLFPALRDDPQTGYGATARRVLTKAETGTLVNAIALGGDACQPSARAAADRPDEAEFSRWDEDLAHERADATRRRVSGQPAESARGRRPAPAARLRLAG